MKSRVLAMLLVLLFVLGMMSSVSAQEMDPCLGLSPDDCALLQASDAADVQSFTMNFDFNLELSNLAAAAAMMGGADEGAPDSITITANASNSPIVMNPDAADASALAMAMDVNYSVAGLGEGTDQAGTFSYVIADGIFYAKDPETGEWKGATLEDMASELGGSGLPFDPSSLMQGDTSELGSMTDPTAALAEAGLEPADIESLMGVPGFIGQQRVADAELEGQQMAAFESTVDFVPLFSSQELQSILTKISTASDDPEAAQIGQMGMLLSMLVKEGNVKLTRWVGVNDQYLRRMVLEINAAVDLAAMMGGAGGEGVAAEPITLKLLLDVQLNNINSTTAPVAPEGAVMEEVGS